MRHRNTHLPPLARPALLASLLSETSSVGWLNHAGGGTRRTAPSDAPRAGAQARTLASNQARPPAGVSDRGECGEGGGDRDHLQRAAEDGRAQLRRDGKFRSRVVGRPCEQGGSDGALSDRGGQWARWWARRLARNHDATGSLKTLRPSGGRNTPRDPNAAWAGSGGPGQASPDARSDRPWAELDGL